MTVDLSTGAGSTNTNRGIISWTGIEAGLIQMGSGNDMFRGGAYADRVNTGFGDDVLYGGGGNDFLSGGQGRGPGYDSG